MKIEPGIVDLAVTYAHPVAAVFAAWSQAEAQQSWGNPGAGWFLEMEKFSFRTGESDICRFGPLGGPACLNENYYLLIEPERRIVCATSLRTDGRPTFAGTLGISFEAAGDGTLMRLIEQGLYLDEADTVDGHRDGWKGMLAAIGGYLDEKAA